MSPTATIKRLRIASLCSILVGLFWIAITPPDGRARGLAFRGLAIRMTEEWMDELLAYYLVVGTLEGSVVQDPWDVDLLLTERSGVVELRSAGFDRVMGTNDDIVVERRRQ